jgi:hypothetical protein
VANKTTQPNEDSTEVLVPAAENRTFVLHDGDQTITLVQKPLSFFQKMEVFSVLGNALDRAMSGPDGLRIGDLFDGPEELSVSNFSEGDTFFKAIFKLVAYAPEILLDLYTVLLGVPRGSREYIKPVLESELPDEDGIAILNTFIDQNWDVMVDFFTVQIRPLIEKVSSKVQESQPSKPSKPTARTTPKA